MIVGIMQPYFFPYIGYFQLMNACDVFVLLDDVQYMKGGWINRNRILLASQPHWLSFPVVKDSLRLNIDQRVYVAGDAERKAVRALLANAYRKAPHFEAALAAIDTLMAYTDANVAGFNGNLLRNLAAQLGIGCRVMSASALPRPPELKGQARVIDLCRQFGADSYINPIGGTGLYDRESFAREGIELNFLRPRPTPYPQFEAPFLPFLSIIDAMMFNDTPRLSHLLDEYDLL